MAVALIRFVGFSKSEALLTCWDEAGLWLEAALQLEKEIAPGGH